MTVANFANFVDDKKELRKEVLEHTNFKDDNGMLAKLKQAWREAEAQTERAITRSASGLDLENIDDPLPDPVFKEVKLAFVKHYSWGDMDSRRVGSDSYHGRCRREFERRLPSMFPVLRVRSLAHSSREAPPKRVRLNDDTYLDTRLNDPENAAGPPCLMTWFSGLDVMTNTWGIVGCFESMYMGQKCMYCHWKDSSEYFWTFQHKALELRMLHPEVKVFKYLSAVEESFRAKAIEYARGTVEVPWGMSLLFAIKNHASIWTEKDDILGKKNNAQGDNRSAGQSSGSALVPAFCSGFNSQNGCMDSGCTAKHACSFRKPNGKTCNMTNHGWANHKEPQQKKGGQGKGGGQGGQKQWPQKKKFWKGAGRGGKR